MNRRGAPVLVLVALAAIPAVLLTSVWRVAESNVPPPTTTTTTTVPDDQVEALTTSLMSFRRVPAPIAQDVADEQAAIELDALVRPLLATVAAGSCVQLSGGGEIIAEESPDVAVIPASTQKLLVAAVALEVLGPDHTFVTEVHAPAPVAGVIAGNVYLVGGGDPVLHTSAYVDPLTHPAINTTALDPLADQLVAAGVTAIHGDIVGDGGRYDDEFRPPDWTNAISRAEGGAIDALLVNDGMLPSGVYGLEPNQAAARTFVDLLRARGITVAGAAANGARPSDGSVGPIASISSRPLDDILVELLHTSDNNTAEMLVKEIGFQGAQIGSRQAGLDVIRSTLGAWNVPLEGAALHDGSGLSRQNRVTCAELTAVVGTSPVAADLVPLLPLAGADGTLRDELLGTPAHGSMRAKTGTLTGVKGLSGHDQDSAGGDVAFALVLNGEGVDDPTVYQPIWAELAKLIDGYPIVVEPDVETFGPR